MGNKGKKRDKEREEREAKEGSFPALMGNTSIDTPEKKKKKMKTKEGQLENTLVHTIVELQPPPSPEVLSLPNLAGGVLTSEVTGLNSVDVVSLVNSSILSNEVKGTVLEEDEEIILMDYDEFDNWTETFTERECDVMAMSFAEFKAEKLAKEAVAGASLVAPTISTTVLTPPSTSVSHSTYVLPTNHASSIIRDTTVGTPKVILDEREAAQRKMKSHTDKSVDIMRQLNMRKLEVYMSEMCRKIDEDAKTLALLQEEKEKEKKEKEELKTRIKLLEARESKSYDLIQTYALKFSNGKGVDPHPNACTNPLNQTVAGRSMNETSGDKTQILSNTNKMVKPGHTPKVNQIEVGTLPPSTYKGTGATSGNKTQATVTLVQSVGGAPGNSTTITGMTGTLSGNKTQVTAPLAKNDSSTKSGNKTQVTTNLGATSNLGAQSINVTDAIFLLDKIKEIKILIQEAEKLFLQAKDSSILSYVVEKKKELGEAQQELTSQKAKNTILISSLVKGNGSPILGTPLPLTMNDFSNAWSNTRCF